MLTFWFMPSANPPRQRTNLDFIAESDRMQSFCVMDWNGQTKLPPVGSSGLVEIVESAGGSI
jgi:hypothetical protein